jgi:hypothetical protein
VPVWSPQAVLHPRLGHLGHRPRTAFCRSCGRDLRPADAKALYARSCGALTYFGWRFPGFDQQVPPPVEPGTETRPTDDQVRAFLRGENVGSCDRCGALDHVGPGVTVSDDDYEALCCPCWWELAR